MWRYSSVPIQQCGATVEFLLYSVVHQQRSYVLVCYLSSAVMLYYQAMQGYVRVLLLAQLSTVGCVLGNAMEDLNLGADFHHMTFNDDPIDDKGDTASVCSSLSAGLASSKFYNHLLFHFIQLGSILATFTLYISVMLLQSQAYLAFFNLSSSHIVNCYKSDYGCLFIYIVEISNATVRIVWSCVLLE